MIPQIHQANWTILIPLCLWWYVISHLLAYPSRHVYPCIGAVVWKGYSDWHLRVPQHPVASIQPLTGQWLLPNPGPDPHWTTSPSLLTNVLKFRLTPRTWVHNCTIWLTASNNWVYWWPVLPGRCGSLLVRRDFGKFLLEPTSLLLAVYFVVIIIVGHNISGMWKGIDNLYNGMTSSVIINPWAIAPQRQYSKLLLLSL